MTAESDVRLDVAPLVELTRAQLQAVIDRHELPVALDDVHRLESIGVVHTIYPLGDDLVLRVPKQHPEAIRDSYTGMVATPVVVVAAGISTPAFVAYNDEREIVPVPFSIFERARGEAFLLRLGADPHAVADE